MLRTHCSQSIVYVGLLALAPALHAQPDQKFADRAKDASQVLTDLLKVPDKGPPQSLLQKATCVAVVPKVVEAAMGVGGKVGYGLVSCRTDKGWGAPAYMGIKGGSAGFQIGGQAADVVMVFVNKNALSKIAGSSFELGAGASVAAGPVGRNLSAGTDYKLDAEIYSYSETKGVFAGINLSGAKWEMDYDANKDVYGRGTDAKEVRTLLESPGSKAPPTVQPFVKSLSSIPAVGN